MEFPGVSIVIPTLNSERTIIDCLRSICEQDYPKGLIEIILVDGGSTDKTLSIARQYTKLIFSNSLRTGESGKALGVKKATGDIVAFIDSDNILPFSGWMKKMVGPFADRDIVASEPIRYTYRRCDRLITRYSALMGMNDPLCYFLGNYDRLNTITGKWTQTPHTKTDEGAYLKVRFLGGKVPTIGANGFMIRRSALLSQGIGEYLFDIDVLLDIIRKEPKAAIAKVKTGIIHIFSGSVTMFIRKQKRRVSDYRFHSRRGSRRYRWGNDRMRIIVFAFFTMTTIPLIWQVFSGWVKKPDNAWLFHIPACWITMWVYALGMASKGNMREMERVGWRQ